MVNSIPFFPMNTTRLFLACALLSVSFSFPLSGAENLITNPGFEDGQRGWGMFIPTESEGKGCEFLINTDSAHSGGACAELKSGNFARFSVGPKSLVGNAGTNDRYRLTFWIRASQDLQAKGKESMIVRIFLLDNNGKPLQQNIALFVGLNGAFTIQSPEKGLDLSKLSGELPKTWTKVESVFEIPASYEAARLGKPEFFAQYTFGSIYLDDVSFERVDSATPLSPSFEKR